MTALLTVPSCTRLEVAMNWADTFAISAVTDYFELSSSQKSQAKAEFNATLHEIQKNDFPLLAEVLERAANRVEKSELEATQIFSFYSEAEEIVKRAYQKFEPQAQKIVDNQAQSNFALFDKEFAKKVAHDREDAEKPETLLKNTVKKFNRWIDNTIEFLTDSQDTQMRDMLKTQPAPVALQINSRESVYEKFKSVRSSEKDRHELIRKIFYDWESLQSSDYLKARKEYHERIKSWTVGLYKNLNDKQKKNLIKNLRSRASELRKLSERNH